MWADPNITGLSFRRISVADDLFIFDTIKATMSEYVRQTYGAWDEEAQRVIVKENTNYDAMRIIARDGKDIGILTCLDGGDHLRIKQLFIIPECQGKGLGAAILDDLKQQAIQRKQPLKLTVLPSNPAQNLYARHGFVMMKRTPQRNHMEFTPAK